MLVRVDSKLVMRGGGRSGEGRPWERHNRISSSSAINRCRQQKREIRGDKRRRSDEERASSRERRVRDLRAASLSVRSNKFKSQFVVPFKFPSRAVTRTRVHLHSVSAFSSIVHVKPHNLQPAIESCPV